MIKWFLNFLGDVVCFKEWKSWSKLQIRKLNSSFITVLCQILSKSTAWSGQGLVNDAAGWNYFMADHVYVADPVFFLDQYSEWCCVIKISFTFLPIYFITKSLS